LAGFSELNLEIARKKGLQPTMTVDGRPIPVMKIGRGERI
jgi:hypothetical protein